MNDRGHLSALDLDLLQLGALAADDAQRARLHLESCPGCGARWHELADATQRFEGRSPRIAGAIAARRRPLWPRLALVTGTLAAAACALLLVVLPPQGVRLKGGPVLQVFGLHQGQVRKLSSGETLAPGDRIRFAVDPGEARFLLIVSIDGTGRASVFFPFGGSASAPLPPGRSKLEESVELDDSPGPERLFAFFTHEPLDAAAVRTALERGATPSPGVEPVTFTLEKEL